MSLNLPKIQDDPNNDPGYAAWAAQMEAEFADMLKLEAALAKQIEEDFTQLLLLGAQEKKDMEDLSKHITIGPDGKITIDAQGLADLKDEFACIAQMTTLSKEIEKDGKLYQQLKNTQFESGGVINMTGDDSKKPGQQSPVPTNNQHADTVDAFNTLTNSFYSNLMNKVQTSVQKPTQPAPTGAEVPVSTVQTGTVVPSGSNQRNETAETGKRVNISTEKTPSKEVQTPSALPLISLEIAGNRPAPAAGSPPQSNANALFEKMLANFKSPETQKFVLETFRKFNQLLTSFAQTPVKADVETALPIGEKADSEPTATQRLNEPAQPLIQKNVPTLTEKRVEIQATASPTEETVLVKTRLVEETPQKANALQLNPSAPQTKDFREETLQAIRTIGSQSVQRLTLQILTESKQPATPELETAIKTASETAVRTAISIAVAILDTGAAPSKEERNDLAVDTAQKTAEAVEAHGSTLAALLTTPRLGNSTPSPALTRNADSARQVVTPAANNGEVDNLVVPFTANITLDARMDREQSIPQFAAATAVLKAAVDQFGPEAALNFFAQQLSLDKPNSSQELLKQVLAANMLQMVGPALNPQRANPMQQINNDNGKNVLFSAIVDKMMQGGRNHTGRDLGEEQVEAENNQILGLSIYNQERVHAQMLAHEVV